MLYLLIILLKGTIQNQLLDTEIHPIFSITCHEIDRLIQVQ